MIAGPPRAGAAVVAMIVVLGGVAISLLILAGKTSVQIKSNQSSALETQQSNELIALGERVLAERLESNPEFAGDTIRLELAASLVDENNVLPLVGTIELVIVKSKENESKQNWTVIANVGVGENSLRQSTKTIRNENLSPPTKPKE